MCKSCWKENGSPLVYRDAVVQAVPLIEKVYEHSSVGGNLHCQLDDDNLSDEFFDEFKIFDELTTKEQELDERICFEFLKQMSEDERRTSLGIYSGYLEVVGDKVQEI